MRARLLPAFLCGCLVVTWPALAREGGAAAGGSALVIEQGSVARHQVVAIGRDLRVDGQALADAAVIDGAAEVTGEIAGDLIVLGGDVHLAASARVGGDLFILGGTLVAAAGSRIEGRAISYPETSVAWLTLLEGPSLGLSATSPLVVGAKLALLTAWLALVLLFFAASGRQVLATSETLRAEPFRCFFVGLVGVLSMLLTALLFSAFAAALVGVPLLLLVVLLAMLLKLWGMVAVFHAAGHWLAGHVLRRRRLAALNAATLGLLVLGAAKLIPYAGTWVWTIATFIGVGAALATKFGRREPWFELGALEAASPARG